jgi:DNA-binding NtrC family response regulator
MIPKIVMIIDDDNNDRFFFKTSLTEIDESIQCIEARNAMVALPILQHTRYLPDFIFLDSNMPGMSGMECLKAIKKDARLEHIPVIMYSGSFNPQQTLQHTELGAAYSLTKSLDFTELPDAIKKVMEIVHANAIYA